MARAAATGRGRTVERLVHDLADGARATAALGAAAETSIDLPGGARTRLRRHRGADIVVGQDVAGADDHGSGPDGISIPCRTLPGKRNRPFLQVV